MSNLKSMASLAKERLKRGMYTNAERIKAKNAMNINSYFIKNLNALKKMNCQAEFVTITDEIDESFINKVYAILNSDKEIYNPIGMLVDQNIYSGLNDIEKQCYIFSIVDKYNKIKNLYYENLAKIG